MNFLLTICLIFFQVLFSSDLELSFENFVDDGEGNVTFEVHMKPSVEVSGFEMKFSSGDGVYNPDDDCSYDNWGYQIERSCYWDTGIDATLNAYEADYVSSLSNQYCTGGTLDEDGDLVEFSGYCTDGASDTKGVCLCGEGGAYSNSNEDCSSGALTGNSWIEISSHCGGDDKVEVEGACSDSSTSEADCTGDLTWTDYDSESSCEAAGLTWWLDSVLCESLITGGAWKPFNPDPSDDNYDEDPVCMFDSGSANSYSGYCDLDSYCYNLSDDSLVFESDGVAATEGNCYSNGGVWADCTDEDDCTSVCNVYSNGVVTGATGVWTSYTESNCLDDGGFWEGNEDGTEGNGEYDLGELFYEKETFLTFTGATASNALNAAGWALSSNNVTFIGFSFSGSTLPVSDSSYPLVAVTGVYDQADTGKRVVLNGSSICKRPGTQADDTCLFSTIIADANAEDVNYDFPGKIWTIGEGAADNAPDDGICAVLSGENAENAPMDCTEGGMNDYAMGDVTMDGIINILDIVKLISIIMGTSESTEMQIYLGDLNGDGIINILDIVMIVNIIIP